MLLNSSKRISNLSQFEYLLYFSFIILGETRDLGMERVDSIDFMLKSTFRQLPIDGPLTVHL